RVDVMVRWRGNQGDPGRGVPKPSDHVGHLEARQLPAFSRLRTLGDLDLDFSALVEVFRGYPKASRRYLLDCRVLIVAIGVRRKAARILSSLATVRLGADPVHRNVEGAVGFWRQGAEAHARGDEPLADRSDRF